MDDVSTPLGILLVVVAVFAALKAVRFIVRLALLLIVAIGLYLWFGAG